MENVEVVRKGDKRMCNGANDRFVPSAFIHCVSIAFIHMGQMIDYCGICCGALGDKKNRCRKRTAAK